MPPIYLNLTIFWIVGGLLFIFLVYVTKNGNRERFVSAIFRNSSERGRREQYKKEYLVRLRQKTLRPRWGRSLVPLAAMLIIVALLLNNYVYFAIVTSDSMSPTMSKGDMVLMTKDVKLEEGDIAIFRAPGQATPVMHRVERIEGDNITTKGDFAPAEDRWDIRKADIYGETVNIGGKPVVLKQVGTYFIEGYQPGKAYQGELEITRLFFNAVKGLAILIFLFALVLYIYLTIVEVRHRR